MFIYVKMDSKHWRPKHFMIGNILVFATNIDKRSGDLNTDLSFTTVTNVRQSNFPSI